MKKITVILAFLVIATALKAQENSVVTGKERISDWTNHLRMEEESLFKNLPWIQIGPLINSGRIASIVGIPGNPSIVYASATVGGVWKTVNAGTTWEPIFEDQPTQTIGDIEVCSTNPNLLWVGTGSSNLSGSAYPGLGVFKTTDGGKNWKHMGLEECQHVMRIAIASNNPDVVYVAAMGSKYYPEEKTIGLYKTSNGGETWKKVLSDDQFTGCADIVIHPENNDIVFASSWNKKKTIGYVWKSIDGGTNWEKVTNGLPDGEKIGRIGIDISLSNPDVIYAYMNNHNSFEEAYPQAENQDKKKEEKDIPKEISLKKIKRMSSKKFLEMDDASLAVLLRKHGIIRSFNVRKIKDMVRSAELSPESFVECVEKYWPESKGGRGGQKIAGEVYKSVDGGKSWMKTHTEPLYLLSSFGWSFCDIKISPDNENDIYILGVTLQHSTDGGKSFEPNEGRQVHMIPNISKFLHLDQHDIWIDPMNSDRILLGNDGGAFISYDRGKNWMHHNTMPIGMFYHLSVDNETPYNIYAGTQDDSHVYGPSDQNLAYTSAEKWKYIWLDRWSGGDGLHIMPDVNDPNTVYYSSQTGALRRKDLEKNENKFVRPKREFCEAELRHDWSTPFYVSPYEKNTIYYGANRLYKSTDKGDNWIALSPDLGKKAEEGKNQNDRLVSIAVDEKNPSIILTGSGQGAIYMTQNGGEKWTLISDSLPAKRANSIEISNHKAGYIFVAFSGNNADRKPYLFMSTDYGANWKSINGNLPLEKTRCITEDPQKAGVLYAGTEKGAYISLNYGEKWYSLSNGLPAVAIDDLLVHPRENELVIATYGRGIYKMDISYIQEMPSDLLDMDVYLFEIKEARLPKNRDYDGDWFYETAKYPEFFFYLKSGGSYHLEISDKDGKVIKTFNRIGEPGINRIEWDLVKSEAKYSKSAYKGGTQLFDAGKYKVELKFNNQVITKELSVKKHFD